MEVNIPNTWRLMIRVENMYIDAPWNDNSDFDIKTYTYNDKALLLLMAIPVK